MPVIISTVVILGICALAVVLMAYGWRHRTRRQSALGPVPELPAHLTTPRFALDDVMYVATSTTGNALDRIVVDPLGFTARAALEVHDAGIAVGLTGSRPFLIPTDRIETVALAQSTIDRAVERDGLLAVRWWIDPDHSVESYFRVVDPTERQALRDALTTLISPSHDQEHA